MYKNRKAMTGLETAIILVAFVITAAAFAFVVLNMGFLTAQKAQSVISAGMTEASSSMLTDSGIVAEFRNTGGDQADIDLVKMIFYLKLSQGHEPIDMDPSKLLGTYTNARCHGVIYPSPADKGESTYTTGTAADIANIIVTGPGGASLFKAALYDASGENELVIPTEAVGDPPVATLPYACTASTDYVVKITEADPGDYDITDDGTTGAGSGSLTVPTDVMTVGQVNGDGDTLLEVGEKFRVTIDFRAVDPLDFDPEGSLTMDGVYVHPYEEFRVELRPAAGSVLTVEKQIPAVYSKIMVID